MSTKRSGKDRRAARAKAKRRAYRARKRERDRAAKNMGTAE